jgi:hypothetical protein
LDHRLVRASPSCLASSTSTSTGGASHAALISVIKSLPSFQV